MRNCRVAVRTPGVPRAWPALMSRRHTSSFFLIVLGVCGLSYGVVDSVALNTVIGASIVITFGIVGDILAETGPG